MIHQMDVLTVALILHGYNYFVLDMERASWQSHHTDTSHSHLSYSFSMNPYASHRY